MTKAAEQNVDEYAGEAPSAQPFDITEEAPSAQPFDSAEEAPSVLPKDNDEENGNLKETTDPVDEDSVQPDAADPFFEEPSSEGESSEEPSSEEPSSEDTPSEELLDEESVPEETLMEDSLTEEPLNEEAFEEALFDESKDEETATQKEESEEDAQVELSESIVTRKIGYVNIGGLNIRKGPGTNYEILGSVSYSTVVIRGQKKDSNGVIWYKIHHHGVTGYICSKSSSTVYVENVRTVKVDANKVAEFPDNYRDALIDLLAVNPHYVFKPNYLKYTLKESVQWHVGAKVDPDYSWSSYDTIYKYMDPFYYLDPQGIFAFAKQTYNSTQNEAGLKKLLGYGNAFLNTASYRKALLEAGKANGVSPYVLAATIIAEKGWHADEDGISAVVGWQVWSGKVTKDSLNVRSGPGTGYGVVDHLSKGTVYIAGSRKASDGVKWYWVIRDNGYGGYVSSNHVTNVKKYDKYYNFFSINQSDDNSDIGGIYYAMKKGWNTPEKSIKGGAVFYKSGYIDNGQDTYYYKDYNVINDQSFWWHEYAGAVHAPAASALLLSHAYADDTTSKVVFKIPIYKSSSLTITPTDITLNKSSLSLLPDKTTTLKATVIPSNATDTHVLWKSSNTAACYVNSSGKLRARAPGVATITATAEGNKTVKAKCKVITKFKDVTSSKFYYYQPVYWALQKGIVSGYSNFEFGVGNRCTRKQMVLFLWRMAGKPKASGSMPFKDVKFSQDSDTYKAILWASSKGIVRGYSDKTFKAGRTVTRSQAVIMLYRIAKRPSVSGTVKFTDVRKLGYSKNSDTYKAILWASQKGIAQGYSNGTFGVRKKCLREHIVTFMYRYSKSK